MMARSCYCFALAVLALEEGRECKLYSTSSPWFELLFRSKTLRLGLSEAHCTRQLKWRLYPTRTVTTVKGVSTTLPYVHINETVVLIGLQVRRLIRKGNLDQCTRILGGYCSCGL